MIWYLTGIIYIEMDINILNKKTLHTCIIRIEMDISRDGIFKVS